MRHAQGADRGSASRGRDDRTPAELLDAASPRARSTSCSPMPSPSVGMLRARTIAEFAQLRHRWFTPHTWTNGLGLLGQPARGGCAVGGGPYLEFPYDPPGWTER